MEEVEKMEIGEVVKQNIYHLMNGMIVYAEDEYVKEEREWVTFDMRNCAVLTRIQDPRTGQTGVTAEKGTGSFGDLWASRLTVRKEAIVARQDTVHEGLRGNVRQVLSGLVLVKK
jgi:hypothetical protein